MSRDRYNPTWRIIVSIAVCILSVFRPANCFLMVSLNAQSTLDSPAVKKELMPFGYQSPLKTISFCVDCNDPEAEGASFAVALASKYGLKDFRISGVVVYCVPNLGDTIINSHQFPDRIVLVNRGGISLWEKVNNIQNAGGAGM